MRDPVVVPTAAHEGRNALALSPVLMRFAPVAVLVFCAVFPAIDLSNYKVRETWVTALIVALLAAYLPTYLHLVYRTVIGAPLRYRGWTLVSTTAAAAVDVLTDRGLSALAAFVVSGLLVMRLRWAMVLATGALTVFGGVLLAADGLGVAIWRVVSVLWVIAAVYSVVWLVGVMRRLQVSRAALVENVVRMERVERRSELRRTLGAALGDIVTEGERAESLLREHSPEASETIEALVRRSRATLAEARRMTSELSRGSVRSELDIAIALLAAAEVDATVDDSVARLDPEDADVREALRSGVADVLATPPRPGAVVTITRNGDQLILTTEEPAGGGR